MNKDQLIQEIIDIWVELGIVRLTDEEEVSDNE